MTTEHGVSGACSIASDLIGYWRLNEGTGLTVIDSSFGGNSGSKNYCHYNDYDGDGNITTIAYLDAEETIVDCTNSDTNCNAATAVCSNLEWYSGWTAGYPFP